MLLADGLKHNLLSINQLYDKKYNVVFESSKCVGHDLDGNLMLAGKRHKNFHIVDLFDSNAFNEKCLIVVNKEPWL